MPKEMMPSSGEFTDMDAYMYLLNILTNPQLFYDASQEFQDQVLNGTIKLPPEAKAIKADLLSKIQRLIEE